MDLLMADRAILKYRRAQIVKCGRDHANGAGLVIWCGQVRVTVEAHVLNLRTREHPRIRRTMRLMTRLASFVTNGLMFEGEGSALIAVAIEASGFIRAETLRHRSADRSVRVVTIDATHGLFGQFVVIRTLELRPDGQMATAALLIDLRRGPRHEFRSAIFVDLVTRRTRDAIPQVTALEPPHVGRLIQMTGETGFIHRGRVQLRGITDEARVGGFCVFLTGTVAGFAGSSLPVAPLL